MVYITRIKQTKKSVYEFSNNFLLKRKQQKININIKPSNDQIDLLLYISRKPKTKAILINSINHTTHKMTYKYHLVLNRFLHFEDFHII